MTTTGRHGDDSVPADLYAEKPPIKAYRGRFAPSPTGPLHFGSLVAAVASYAQALRHKGEWLVRIEDIDPTREVPGATDSILHTLTAHGFEFPEPLLQSTRLDLYDEAIAALLQSGDAYPCSCTRQALLRSATRGRAGLVYPGTCRDGADESQRKATAVRLNTQASAVSFIDALQGPQHCDVEHEIGDFLLRRGDGFVSYQLAVAYDDAAQQITEVVRGTDLLDSTFMQLLVLEKLGKSAPAYAHCPVVTGPGEQKLSKQTGATSLDNNQPNINILRALSFLLQEPPAALKTASLQSLWAWVEAHWDPTRLEGVQTRSEKSIMVR